MSGGHARDESGSMERRLPAKTSGRRNPFLKPGTLALYWSDREDPFEACVDRAKHTLDSLGRVGSLKHGPTAIFGEFHHAFIEIDLVQHSRYTVYRQPGEMA